MIKFNCPACNKTIMSGMEAATKGVQCPKCGTGFVPDNYTEEEFQYSGAPAPATTRNVIHPALRASSTAPAEKIKRQAESFEHLSFVLVVIGVIALLVGIFNSIGTDAHGGGFCWVVMGVCFSAAFWVYTIAQIIHIRANTER